MTPACTSVNVSVTLFVIYVYVDMSRKPPPGESVKTLQPDLRAVSWFICQFLFLYLGFGQFYDVTETRLASLRLDQNANDLDLHMLDPRVNVSRTNSQSSFSQNFLYVIFFLSFVLQSKRRR